MLGPSGIPELLNDGKLAVEKGSAPAVVNGQPYLKQLVDFTVPPLVEAMAKVGEGGGFRVQGLG